MTARPVRDTGAVPRATAARALHAVKLVHTVIWAFFVTAIVAVSVCGWARRYALAMIFAAMVFAEILVLAANGWRCPLTAIAARYTTDRRANFDIYLPEWLARHNKGIFGGLFAGGLLLTVLRGLELLG
jgi:hypothetical protein